RGVSDTPGATSQGRGNIANQNDPIQRAARVPMFVARAPPAREPRGGHTLQASKARSWRKAGFFTVQTTQQALGRTGAHPVEATLVSKPPMCAACRCGNGWYFHVRRRLRVRARPALAADEAQALARSAETLRRALAAAFHGASGEHKVSNTPPPASISSLPQHVKKSKW